MYHQALIRPSRWGLLRRAIGFALVWSLATGAVFIPGVWAATYYVNDDTGDDNRTPAQAQSAATPWQTITRAITEATLAAGDTIDVAGGTYDAALGEIFPLYLVDGVAIAGADSNTTTITGPIATALFVNNDTPLASGTTLSGFTLTHDAGDLANGAMSFTLASADMAPVISENHFQGVGGYGQGINITDTATGARSFTGVIKDNAFSDLHRHAFQAYVTLSGTEADISPTIHHNTFTDIGYSSIGFDLGGSYEGAVSPVIENNLFPGYSGPSVILSFSNSSGHGGTMVALISGNTVTGSNNSAIFLNLGSVSLSSTSNVATFAPTVLNNTIDDTSGTAIGIDLYGPSVGTVDFDLTIAGNTITDSGNRDGINLSVTNFTAAYSASVDFDVTIINNTISEARSGIVIDLNSSGSYLSGPVDLTIAGNTITDSDDRGVDISFSSFDDSEIDFNLTVQGNTVTFSGTDGFHLENTVQDSFAGSHTDILDNVIDGSAGRALHIESTDFSSPTSYVKVACNTVLHTQSDGIYIHADDQAPNPDFGGGGLSSVGRNTVFGSVGYDFYNDDPDLVDARFNWWGTTDDATIDSHIWDNDEDHDKGAVDYSSYLSAAPTVTATASLVDALEIDLSPPGPSYGDTIRYTATLEGTGDCGCAAALFTVPIPDNGTFIPDSLTASRGILINEAVSALHPELKVGLGALEAGESVTITWDVIAGDGCSMTSQATLSCYQLGDLLTDDPDVGGGSDPTTIVLDHLFCDGFESGDTDIWSNSVP